MTKLQSKALKIILVVFPFIYSLPTGLAENGISSICNSFIVALSKVVQVSKVGKLVQESKVGKVVQESKGSCIRFVGFVVLGSNGVTLSGNDFVDVALDQINLFDKGEL